MMGHSSCSIAKRKGENNVGKGQNALPKMFSEGCFPEVSLTLWIVRKTVSSLLNKNQRTDSPESRLEGNGLE